MNDWRDHAERDSNKATVSCMRWSNKWETEMHMQK